LLFDDQISGKTENHLHRRAKQEHDGIVGCIRPWPRWFDKPNLSSA